MHTNAASIPLSKRLTESLSAYGEPLLFGLRLWASVCLALFVAFWLELDDPFWAGTSAAIVCQPQLGASLRKGWFRMIGTVVGATMIVVLTAFFPQDRVAYLGLLALWCSICAFGATVLRNFASYSAALAGYTAAFVGVGTLGATGGTSPDVFMLAITRATDLHRHRVRRNCPRRHRSRRCSAAACGISRRPCGRDHGSIQACARFRGTTIAGNASRATRARSTRRRA